LSAAEAMKKPFLIVLIFSSINFGNLLTGQDAGNDISGHVLDQSTGKPIENVNVYIANTTRGMPTDQQGYYIIRNLPAGIHELVASMAGYQYSTRSVLLKMGSHLQADFHLTPIVYETSPTVVLGEVPREWLANLEKFKHYFLGQSEFAHQCEIENPEVLDFAWNSSNFFTATAIAPLVIFNRALGLKIDCVLVYFSWDGSNNKWSWSIKPKFAYLQPLDSAHSIRWKQNRRSANQGSLFHFLKTLIRQKLNEEGYLVYFVDHSGETIWGGAFQFISSDYSTIITPGRSADEWQISFRKYLYIKDYYGRVSWLKLNLAQVNLDSAGYTKDMNAVEVYGHWATQGVADLLPRYEIYH
jgi:hypothetical protein